jgi:hypothetical protein
MKDQPWRNVSRLRTTDKNQPKTDRLAFSSTTEVGQGWVTFVSIGGGQ